MFVTTVFVLILFALLFIFPRLLYIRKTGTVTSLWSLLIALGILCAAATALASQPEANGNGAPMVPSRQ